MNKATSQVKRQDLRRARARLPFSSHQIEIEDVWYCSCTAISTGKGQQLRVHSLLHAWKVCDRQATGNDAATSVCCRLSARKKVGNRAAEALRLLARAFLGASALDYS
jgi:hypothetical protein